MKYVDQDFEMGFTDLFSNILGGSTLTQAIGDLAYREAMKLVEKEANIVRTFSSRAVNAANIVAAQVQAINIAATQEESDRVLEVARTNAQTASNEASNASKNYAATLAAMKTLTSIKGLPQTIIDSANAIQKGALSALNNANNAVQRANEALRTVQSIHNSKYGTFFSNLTLFGGSGSRTYLLIGGGLLVAGLLGFAGYKMIKKRKSKSVAA
jgi:hypothetical protein